MFIKIISRSIFLLLITSLISCENFSWLPKDGKKTKGRKEKVVNGIDKKYMRDGSLHSIINYKDGVRHGISKSYYKSGKLQLVIPYDMGEKEGVLKMYFENGKLRRETEYKKGQKNGSRKSYFTTGVLSSEISYKNDMPANDLLEYLKSGKKRSKYPELKTKVIDNLNSTGEYIVKVYFTKNKGRADYFIGKLDEGKYFDRLTLTSMSEDDNEGFLIFTPPPGKFIMDKIYLVGKLKTARGNPLIQTKVFNLAIEGQL